MLVSNVLQYAMSVKSCQSEICIHFRTTVQNTSKYISSFTDLNYQWVLNQIFFALWKKAYINEEAGTHFTVKEKTTSSNT